MNDELLYRRYVALSTILMDIEEGHLAWHVF